MPDLSNLHILSLNGFRLEAATWATESQDHVSLNKFSIWLMLQRALKKELKGNYLALYLRAVALKREYEGASRFIFWSFANYPIISDKKETLTSSYEPNYEHIDPIDAKSLHGVGAPTDAIFQSWLRNKLSIFRLEIPEWDLPILADYADEFLQMFHQLKLLSQEFLLIPVNQGEKNGEISLSRDLDKIIYFEKATELISLAEKIIAYAEKKYRENHIDLILQAFKKVSMDTGSTALSKGVVERPDSTLLNVQRKEEKIENNDLKYEKY